MWLGSDTLNFNTQTHTASSTRNRDSALPRAQISGQPPFLKAYQSEPPCPPKGTLRLEVDTSNPACTDPAIAARRLRLSRGDLLAYPQPEPFKQVPGKRVAAAFIGNLPPARAPRPPFPFQLFRGGLLGMNCRVSILLLGPPALLLLPPFLSISAFKGMGGIATWPNVCCNVELASHHCLPRVRAVVCWDFSPLARVKY